MLEVPVYNIEGKEVGQLSVDESRLGGRVRPALLKQAIVRHHANQRQGSATTKGRSTVVGSGAKLYRQKGTGNARVGNRRTVVRKGGGVAFAKVPRDFSQRMPKKQRQLARDSAVLSKLQSQRAVVVEGLSFSEPKTREFARILGNLNIDRSCLVAMAGFDENTYKSLRNIPRVDAVHVEQLNAGDILRRQVLLFTRPAFEALLNREPVAAAQPGSA